MGEFVDTMKQQAVEVLRRTYRQEPSAGTDPMVELMGVLLEDGVGGVQALSQTLLTTEQWITWHRLVMERPRELVRMLTQALERERMELPPEAGAMRAWAAQLLLSTLDEMGMA